MRLLPLKICVRVFAVAVIFAAAAAAQDVLPELVRRVEPSSVAIVTYDARGNVLTRGSGFFVASDRVVTNQHVIAQSSRAEISLLNGKKYPVRGVLAVDGEGDLALLQVDVPPGMSVPLPLGANLPAEGESIVVVGNPFGLEGSVSNGIVSAVREISGYGRIIQITAPISSGSSGSPVVNMAGQVVGIATLQSEQGQGLNFAVPSERIAALKAGNLQSFAALAADTQKSKRGAAERFYSQGVALLSRDDCTRAAALFEKAVELDANYAEAWYQAGFCYGVLGRPNEALRASRQAAKLRPDWPEAYVNIGASSFALGQFKEAADAYRAAARLDAENPETQYALALALNKLNRNGEEIIALKRAVLLKPDFANALERLGTALYKQKRFTEAADSFEQLRAYRPDAKTFNYLGESYYEIGKYDESLTAFNNAVGFDAAFDRARYNLGRVYIKMGNSEMARVQYEILRNSRSDWADRLLAILNQ